MSDLENALEGWRKAIIKTATPTPVATPRTDAFGRREDERWPDPIGEWIGFARKLEIELAAANERAEIAECNWRAQKGITQLREAELIQSRALPLTSETERTPDMSDTPENPQTPPWDLNTTSPRKRVMQLENYAQILEDRVLELEKGIKAKSRECAEAQVELAELRRPTPRPYKLIGCVQHDCEACITRENQFKEMSAALTAANEKLEAERAQHREDVIAARDFVVNWQRHQSPLGAFDEYFAKYLEE